MPATVTVTCKEILYNLMRLIVLYPTGTTESANTLRTQNRQFHFGKIHKEMSGNDGAKSSLFPNSVTILVLV